MDMYHRAKKTSAQIHGIGEGKPLICDICNKIVHKIKISFEGGNKISRCEDCQ